MFFDADISIYFLVDYSSYDLYTLGWHIDIRWFDIVFNARFLLFLWLFSWDLFSGLRNSFYMLICFLLLRDFDIVYSLSLCLCFYWYFGRDSKFFSYILLSYIISSISSIVWLTSLFFMLDIFKLLSSELYKQL